MTGKSTILSNEKIGRMIEVLVHEGLKTGELCKSRRRCYDIETDKTLIEVKSARTRTFDNRAKNRTRTGRFVITKKSHEDLLSTATYSKKKMPLYVFVLYRLNDESQPEIIKTKTLSWFSVDAIVQERPLVKRVDGSNYYLVPHTLVWD